MLEDGVEIGRGALIGDGVKLAKGVRVPEFSRVGRRRYRKDGWEEGDEEDEEDARLEGLSSSCLVLVGTVQTVLSLQLMCRGAPRDSWRILARFLLAAR